MHRALCFTCSFLPCLSNTFSFVNFLPSGTDNFSPPPRGRHAAAHYLHTGRVKLTGPSAAGAPRCLPREDGITQTAMERSKWGKRRAVMLFTSTPPPRRSRRRRLNTPQINLISCRNCSGNVTSRKLILTEEKKTRIRDSFK